MGVRPPCESMSVRLRKIKDVCIMLKWRELFRSHILERGWDYAKEGNVTDLVKTDDSISAVVKGGEHYKVKIRYSGSEITDGYCSCPYAAKGEWCKHMAAVLFLAESGSASDKSFGVPYTAAESQSIEEIIKSADRKDIEELLIHLANQDERMESFIRANLRSGSSSDVKQIEKEIDGVFYAYGDRTGYIDYYNAMSFASDLDSLIRNRIGALIDDESYMDAFNASIYAYTKLGNCDIDDDGEIASISSTCYELWQSIITSCDPKVRECIKEWFEEHSDDGTVIDYMEDMLQDFLKYELASEAELKEIIKGLEEKIESSRGQIQCPGIFTSYYGYSIDAIELRNIFARRIGITEEEIEKYMRRYMSFRSVRDYFIKKATEQNNTDEEIKILTLGKEFEKDSAYTMHSYSKRLIELYVRNKDKVAEKLERKADLLINQGAPLEDYRAYRAMCNDEEWLEERLKIIESRNNVDKRCELLAEEKMYDKLFDTIWEQKDKLGLMNKYGFALEGDYSEHILDFYAEFVSGLAEYACNRSRYDELNRYLMRMSQYPGGEERVRRLALEWIDKYPTRKVMVKMLQGYRRHCHK